MSEGLLWFNIPCLLGWLSSRVQFKCHSHHPRTQDLFLNVVSQLLKKLSGDCVWHNVCKYFCLPVLCCYSETECGTGSSGQRVSGSDSLRGKFRNRLEDYHSMSTMDCERLPPCLHAWSPKVHLPLANIIRVT